MRCGAWAIGLVLGCLAASARAERQLQLLPHVEDFDAEGDYDDLIWTTQGCAHSWSAEGYQGGAAKFTPPLEDQGACGLGQFILSGLPSIPEQLNLRFLIYHGSTWREFGPGNKLVIMNREGNDGRPMIITREFDDWETWGACDGTVCKYEEGDFWPLGGDRLRIGNPPTAREEEWISVEFEANTESGMIRLYVDTLDGDLSGLYVERYMDDTGPGGVWSYIDLVGGYMEAASEADPNNYFMLDALVIDSQRIGPPPGFGVVDAGGVSDEPTALNDGGNESTSQPELDAGTEQELHPTAADERDASSPSESQPPDAAATAVPPTDAAAEPMPDGESDTENEGGEDGGDAHAPLFDAQAQSLTEPTLNRDDAAPSSGGASDAGDVDATTAGADDSGCACVVGHSEPAGQSGSHWTAVALAGLVLLRRRSLSPR